jgi:flagellar motor protein MotB
MRRTFLSMVGFVNVIGAMNGQPQLDFDILKEDGKIIITSNYLPGEQTKKPGKAPINYNFSPTATFQGDRFVLSSTLGLARELLTAREIPRADVPAGGKLNTTMQLHVPTLKQILTDNQQQLVAQNMLEEGHSKEEAEKEIETILELIDLVRGMTVALIQRSERLELRGAVLLKPSE